MKALLHAADISKPIRPFAVAQLFAERVHAVFQGSNLQELIVQNQSSSCADSSSSRVLQGAQSCCASGHRCCLARIAGVPTTQQCGACEAERSRVLPYLLLFDATLSPSPVMASPAPWSHVLQPPGASKQQQLGSCPWRPHMGARARWTWARMVVGSSETTVAGPCGSAGHR